MNAKIDLLPNNRFSIVCGVEHAGLCRDIPNRRFSKTAGVWIAPVLTLNCKYLAEKFGGATWTDAARTALIECMTKSTKAPREPFPFWYKFNTQPYAHQTAALNRAWGVKYFGLFMEMGTGKTKVAIDLACASAMNGDIKTCIVIAPMTLRLTWLGQLREFATVDCDVEIFSSKKRETFKVAGGQAVEGGLKFVLVGIESLSAGSTYQKLFAELPGFGNFMAIVDESAWIKNKDALRTVRCSALGAYAHKRIIMSGLPVLKGPLDLYSQIEFLSKDILGIGDYYSFRNRYAIMGGFEGKEIVGYRNLDELTELIAPHVFQVTKKEALDLPPKIYTEVLVSLSDEQKKCMTSIKKGVVSSGDKPKLIANALEKVLRMQQVTSGFTVTEDGKEVNLMPVSENPKIKAMVDIIESHNDNVKFVVWCRFRKDWDNVVQALGRYGVVGFNGGHSPEYRQHEIEKFKDKSNRVFVGTLQSGGIGITIVEGSVVFYFSNSWETGHRSQSEDRTHRIGQVADKVSYIDLIVPDSVDDRVIMRALKNKKGVADYVSEMIANQQESYIYG